MRAPCGSLDSSNFGSVATLEGPFGVDTPEIQTRGATRNTDSTRDHHALSTEPNSDGRSGCGNRTSGPPPRQLFRSQASQMASSSTQSASNIDGGATVRVRVAARVRPLLPLEAIGPRGGAPGCIEIAGEGCILAGKSRFTFDRVFGTETSQEEVYEEYVEPLVEALFEGFNATLLAYGQTGSGKTYTMGTSGLPSVPEGVLQRAIRGVFARAQATEDGAAEMRVSYIEIFTDSKGSGREEVRDLLSPGRAPGIVSTRRDVDGQIKLEGIAENGVWTEREALRLLTLGSTARATCATRLNDASSRSHAIFSLELLQRRVVEGVPATLTAKFQFVDLAGSEKVKVSGAEGEQLSQAININHGLFVLGKVITALTEKHPHVPFRESTLTRIVQNSLGGNSRTCMIACISPSEANLAESISTLTYAARAKEIRNSPAVNLHSSCANCARLQAKLIEALENVQIDVTTAGPGNALRHVQHADCTEGNTQEHTQQSFSREQKLEKENSVLRQENEQLQAELIALRAGHTDPLSPGVPECDTPYFGRSVASLAWPTTSATSVAELRNASSVASCAAGTSGVMDEDEQMRQLKTAEALAARNEALFKRCSERLVALQQAVQDQGLNVDDGLYDEPLLSMEEFQDAEDISFDIGDADAATLAWLEKETQRKQQLLIQVQENHQAMALLEEQSLERIEQHRAARDLAEQELARLQAELEDARSREEQLTTIQQSYDQRLEVLQARNQALEQEQAEMRRLNTMQQRQATRLRVLQDSIRQVTEERDRLKNQLAGEVRKRREQEASMKTERNAAEKKIRSLHTRLALLERSTSLPANAAGSSSKMQRTGSSSKPGSNTSLVDSPQRATLKTRSAASEPGAMSTPKQKTPTGNPIAASSNDNEGVKPWQVLLQHVAERALRERQLAQGKASFEKLQSQLLSMSAQRERLSVEAELDAGETPETTAAIQALDVEFGSVSVALEYQAEQVWMLQRDFDSCPPCDDVTEAATKIANRQKLESLVAGAVWLCSEAAKRGAIATAAREELDAQGADAAACRAAMQEGKHHASEREQAFDQALAEYESRVSFLLGKLNEQGHENTVRSTASEDTVTLMSKQIAELEGSLSRQRQEPNDHGLKRWENDIELITRLREQESLNKRLENQVKEAVTQVEQIAVRSARKEAQLSQQIHDLESRCRANEGEKDNLTHDDWEIHAVQDIIRAANLSETAGQDFLRGLRSDVRALCDEKLRQHSQLKKSLEEKIQGLNSQLTDLVESLGDKMEAPPTGLTLIERVQHLEASIAGISAIRNHRFQELSELNASAGALHERLYEASVSLQPMDAPCALQESALHAARERVEAFKKLEGERSALVIERESRLKALWQSLGLQVPEALDPQEVSLLEGRLPLSESSLMYLDNRCARLTEAQQELQIEEDSLRDRLEYWRHQLAPFGLPIQLVPNDMALLPCIKLLKDAVVDAELLAGSFVQEQRELLVGLENDARLPNLSGIIVEIDSADGFAERLSVLTRYWEVISAQRAAHKHLTDLIADREALETEMRDFDLEASHPSRFRRRGYSAIEESKRRNEYQKRLRTLDTMLSTSLAEWETREGIVFCVGGVEYQGSELLSPEHVHTHAWTGKEVVQKQAHEKPHGDRRSTAYPLTVAGLEDCHGSGDIISQDQSPQRGRGTAQLEMGGGSSPNRSPNRPRRSFSSGASSPRGFAVTLSTPSATGAGTHTHGSVGALRRPTGHLRLGHAL